MSDKQTRNPGFGPRIRWGRFRRGFGPPPWASAMWDEKPWQGEDVAGEEDAWEERDWFMDARWAGPGRGPDTLWEEMTPEERRAWLLAAQAHLEAMKLSIDQRLAEIEAQLNDLE